MSTAYYDPLRPLGKPAEAAAIPQFSIHTVLVAARCWWHIALPLGLLLASASAVVVYYTSTPTYTAQAWLMVKARPPIIVSDISVDDPQKFVQNQIELMRSPMVLSRVVSDSAVAATPELVKELDPVQYLRTHLRVRPQNGSDYYIIEFTSQSPEKAELVANAVADEYRAMQERHEKRLSGVTIEKLQDQLKLKEVEVNQLKVRLDDLAKQLDPAAAAALAGKHTERTDASSPRAYFEHQLLTISVDQIELRVTIAAAKQLLTQLSFEPSDAQVNAIVQSRPEVQKVKALIDEMKSKLAQHKDRSIDPKKNPLHGELERKIQSEEATLEKSLADARPEIREALKQAAFRQRQDEILELESSYQKLEEKGKQFNEELKKLGGKQQEHQGNALEYELARDDYERQRDTLEAIKVRIDRMSTELGAPARIELLQAAVKPTRPDEAIPYKKMGMFACAALLAPFGLAVGIEILFRRVSSRQQLEAAGQISVVGEVTTLPARVNSRQTAGPDQGRDRQLFEESIDGLRTYLSLVETMRGRRVLAVTSAISREGKTSLASQLAVSIASATGRPTLLIDGDLRSPDVHRIFDVDRGPGLYEVLTGKNSVEEAIETGFSDTLHLLTAGELTASPHRVLSNNSFGALIAKLGTMYEQIVIDTPPILAASEALLMASAADAAVLCVRRDFSRLDQVSEAFTRLRSAGVKTAGAVLNGIPARHYAYRYGSYYYNRHPLAAADQESASESAVEPG